MARVSSILFLNWITATMCYYGLTMLSVNLTDDIYVSFVLSALIEIPSYIFCILVSITYSALVSNPALTAPAFIARAL